MITTKKSLKSGLNITELVEFKISGVLNTIQNTDDIKKKKKLKAELEKDKTVFQIMSSRHNTSS